MSSSEFKDFATSDDEEECYVQDEHLGEKGEEKQFPKNTAAAAAAPSVSSGSFHEDPLYIEDYTCSTPFEELISKLEELLRKSAGAKHAGPRSALFTTAQRDIIHFPLGSPSSPATDVDASNSMVDLEALVVHVSHHELVLSHRSKFSPEILENLNVTDRQKEERTPVSSSSEFVSNNQRLATFLEHVVARQLQHQLQHHSLPSKNIGQNLSKNVNNNSNAVAVAACEEGGGSSPSSSLGSPAARGPAVGATIPTKKQAEAQQKQRQTLLQSHTTILLLQPANQQSSSDFLCKTMLSAACCAAEGFVFSGDGGSRPLPEDEDEYSRGGEKNGREGITQHFNASNRGVLCMAKRGDSFREAYSGYYFNPKDSYSQRLQLDTLPNIPHQFQYLTGILDVFHLNLGLQSVVVEDRGSTIWVEATHHFQAESPGYTARKDVWERIVENENEALLFAYGPSAPFGTSSDPIQTYHCKMRWAPKSERHVEDNSVHTTFDPVSNPPSVASVGGAADCISATAPTSSSAADGDNGAIAISVTETNSYEYVTVGSETISEVFQVLLQHLAVVCDATTAEEEEGRCDEDEDYEMRERSSVEGRRLRSAMMTASSGAPHASPQELLSMQEVIFDVSAIPPPAATKKRIAALWKRPMNDDEKDSDSVDYRNTDPRFLASPNSFFARFAHQAHYLKHADDVYDLWMMVTKELASLIDTDTALRLPWEKQLLVLLSDSKEDGGAGGSDGDDLEAGEDTSSLQSCMPDINSVLVNQKLQLLKYCAVSLRQEKRDNNQNNSNRSSRERATAGQEEGWEEEDDFEFDALEDGEDRVVAPSAKEASASSPPKKMGTSIGDKIEQKEHHSAAEELSPHPLRMILDGRVLIAPSKIENPVTLDMIQEHQEAMSKLGSGHAAKVTRDAAFHQSLLEDMCQFLKANELPGATTGACGENGEAKAKGEALSSPSSSLKHGCYFSDFVRWHSPRDFIGVVGEPKSVHSIPPSATQEKNGGEKTNVVTLSLEEEKKLLSTRMSDTTSIWWQLWVGQAKPKEYVSTFNAVESIQLASRWLQDSVTQEEVQLWVCVYTVVGVVHRLASHHTVQLLPSLQRNVQQLVAALRQELQWWLHNALESVSLGAEGNADHQIFTVLRGRVKNLCTLVSKLEVHVCGAISLYETFLKSFGEEKSGPAAGGTVDDDVLAVGTIDALYQITANRFGTVKDDRAKKTPLYQQQPSTSFPPQPIALGGGAAAGISFAIASDNRGGTHLLVTKRCWQLCLQSQWIAAAETLKSNGKKEGAGGGGGATSRKKNKRWQHSNGASSIPAASSEFRLYCTAERPMNTAPLPQLLHVLTNTLEDEMELSLCLSEGF